MRSLALCLVVAVLLVISVLAANAQDHKKCIEDGIGAGKKAAETFCYIWEKNWKAAQEGKGPVLPFMLPIWVCDLVSVEVCKATMSEHVRDNRPLCKEIIDTDWRGAEKAWAGFRKMNCNCVKGAE